MDKKDFEKLYSEEISLLTSPEHSEYVEINLRKIKEYRRNFGIPVIGISGAEGKSTTKGMISAILSQRGPVLETPLDCNSASVVSSTLLQLRKNHKYCILELGIINRQQFRLAVELAEPTIGVITNIGEAHLAGLGDKYLIADAKLELIRQLKSDGFAILNIDDELVSRMESYSGTQRIVKFGFNNAAHFYATDINYLGPDGIQFTVNDYYKFVLPAYSSTAVTNALAAIATARALEFEFDEISEGLKKNFKLISGRGNLIQARDIFILDHTYNATINSVPKACESLVQFKKFSKNLILVVGSLEELGKVTGDVHTNIGYYISALPIDMVITVGKDARLIGEGIRRINHNKKIVQHCPEAAALPKLLMKVLSPHSTILMTGGKSLNLSHELKKVVSQL
ncbi:MAG: UDP-N-acetylmuramoyl-tripeptide--D-alanyl-D-alanine ligase [Calditrichaeota bacterium]|nr:UDP-N-acetylmuramoyl-tripeptide--D-alanyl-D-alanine ligase [Calditrichota bacterium]